MIKYTLKNITKIVFLVVAVGLFAGCAGTEQKSAASPDPIEPANRAFYSFNETLDKHLIKPIAETYANITPEPIRSSVTNFFDNLAYLNVILNSFLQGKIEQGFSDAARFLMNSTLGIAGVFDVATPAGLPRHNEDLGQTLEQLSYQNIIETSSGTLELSLAWPGGPQDFSLARPSQSAWRVVPRLRRSQPAEADLEQPGPWGTRGARIEDLRRRWRPEGET